MILISFAFVWFVALLIYAYIRNNEVFNYRIRLINKLYDLEDWEEHHKKFIQVSYNETYLTVWKRLDSWFEEEDFNVKL